MKWMLPLLMLLLLFGSVAAQEDAPPTQPVVLRLASSADPNTFDPLLAQSTEDMTYATNLFIGLTRIDPQTGDILPSLATSWEVSDDGLTWTFVLRDDVFWVRYDVASGEFEQLDHITANDVVYTINRLCSGTELGYYAVDLFAKRIAGCEEGQSANDGTFAQASAPADNIFTITLTAPYGSFLSMATLPAMRPQNGGTIETHGTNWAFPNNIVTSGAFALRRFVPNVGITLVRNPFYPTDLRNGGNIDEVDVVYVPNFRTQFDMYQESLLDITGVPIGDVNTVLEDATYATQLVELEELTAFFIGFSTDKAPFDDVHLRRAFAAAIDRQAFIDRVRFGRDVPANSFTPQGVAHAPQGIGVGYNPEYARQQLALSGYPDCQNLPTIDLLAFSGAGSWGTYLVSQWVELFGCDLARFTVNEIGFNDLLILINPTRTEIDARPNMFTLGWGADYADADSYASFVECGMTNFFGRACSAVDEQIAQARRITDHNERATLYTQIETLLFGDDGEFPMITLYIRKRALLAQEWLSGAFDTDGRLGAVHYDAYTVDVAVRGENIRCEVTNNRGSAINRRVSPSTQADIAGQIANGESTRAIGQGIGADNILWWQLETGDWVRSDLVTTSGQCSALPTTN